MKRKRYMKLCMSNLHFDRNAADFFARKTTRSFADKYEMTRTMTEQAKCIFNEAPVGFTVKQGDFILNFNDFYARLTVDD